MIQKYLIRISDYVNKLVEHLLALLILIMFVIIVYGVFRRYVLRNPVPWIVPLSTMLLIWVGILGISVAFKRKAHVKVSSGMRLMPKKIRKYIFYFNYILILLWLGLVVNYGIYVTLGAQELIMLTANLQIPRYTTMAAVPIFGFLNIIHILPLPYRVEQENKEIERSNQLTL